MGQHQEARPDLKPLCTVTIDVSGDELTAGPAIDAETQDFLNQIIARTGH